MRQPAQKSNEPRHAASSIRSTLLKWGLATTLAFTGSMALTGCGEETNGNTAAPADTTPTVSADNYKILHDTPGTPAGRLDPFLTISSRMGLTMTRNMIHGLDLTDAQPPLVIEGREHTKGGGRYVKSRKLRIEDFLEPEGSRMVQVNVSLNSPFALKSLRGVGKHEFVPGPLLQDNIGNSYWPSGYILKEIGGEQKIEIFLNRGKQIKNINDLPRLSRNKEQELRILFFVNIGVNIESFSYGGGEPKQTFSLPVPRR